MKDKQVHDRAAAVWIGDLQDQLAEARRIADALGERFELVAEHEGQYEPPCPDCAALDAWLAASWRVGS